MVGQHHCLGRIGADGLHRLSAACAIREGEHHKVGHGVCTVVLLVAVRFVDGWRSGGCLFLSRSQDTAEISELAAGFAGGQQLSAKVDEVEGVKGHGGHQLGTY